MTAVTFVAGHLWPLLAAVPLVVLVGAWWARRAAEASRQALGAREPALVGGPVHTALRAGAAVAAACCASLALLQPAWGLGDGEPPAADLVVCLDVSRSMAARDQTPSRLGAAQQQLERLAPAALGARIGLVVFAGEARLVAPLTRDGAAVALLAHSHAAGAVGRGGTDVGAALEVAFASLQRAGAAAGSIVVLSDGEDFAGRGVDAAARAHAAGGVVHCLGFGDEAGSRIVVETPGGEVFLQDGSGDDVVTRLDGAGLAAIAKAGGGSYGPARDAEALRRLYDERLAPRAVAAAVAAGTRAPAHRYQWFLLAALAFWMLRWWLPERRR